MNRRASYIVVALLALALVAVGLVAYPGSPFQRTPTLGLDLQGGLEVTLQAIPPADRELTESDLDRSVEIMRSRVDKLGVTEPEIRKQGSDQISIQLPGVKDPRAAAEIIGTTAQLELYDLERSLTGPSIAAGGVPVEHTSLYRLLARVQAQVEGDASAYYVVNQRAERVVSGPHNTEADALEALGGELPANRRLFGVPPDMVVITCGEGAVVCPGAQGQGLPPTQTYYYLFKHTPPDVPELTGEDFELDGTRADFDTSPGGGGRPIVTMEFTDDGGRAQIQGLESIREARDIAIVLQTGALPVEFETLASDDVSATLGKDSLEEAKLAALAGLLLVAIFLLAFYRFLGVVAVLGLAIYAAFLYAAILLFNVTLTLPGFAGLVLTFGVAADANVVIFERIKEEVRAGRSVRAAISLGYTRGFHTIVDANVVTMITAAILFAVATASVRGFALMLLIGTALSMLTAVLATRALLTMLSGFSWFDKPAFMGATAREIPRWQRIDVCGRRRLWFVISLVAIGLSVVSLGVKGLNLGIDFEGGTQIRFTTEQPAGLSIVREQVAGIGQEGAIVQGRGEVQGAESYSSFQIRTVSLAPPDQDRLTQALAGELGAEIESVRNVSASFSRQILTGAILAIIVSFALISFYVTARYEWRFALPILRTLFNDVVITVGIYSISGREVSAGTVAAILAILGYSVYDTIIVFDRVRENMKLMPRAPFATIANVSLWEVLRRSMVTTFSTLLPIGALYFFGGATLKDFAFAIIVGILIGAVSTLFVATPLLATLMEMHPEWRRRRDAVTSLAGVQSVGGALGDAQRDAEELDGALGQSDAGEPEPVGAGAGAGQASPGTQPRASSASASKRERRRQRRAARPHGRPR